MKNISSHRILVAVAFLILYATQTNAQLQELHEDSSGLHQQANFPYHPLVYHLDLATLAYNNYGQSLVWPFDPYYEESDKKRRRKIVIKNVHNWAKIKGAEQVKSLVGINGYRGPGILNGFANNESHDPIIYRYSQVYPLSSSLTNPDGSWIEYNIPKAIISKIKDIYVGYRKAGEPADSVVIEKIPYSMQETIEEARDVLLAFEGGTGDKGETNQPASQSLMGFVLMRYYSNSNDYDIHIAFRGSRSGSGGRAVFQAIKTKNAKGNPDWITDLGYHLLSPEKGGAFISEFGKVSRGMTKAMEHTAPNIFQCLKMVSTISNDVSPTRIYVTGHSLGGALAQFFASTILLGNQYGPNGSGKAMPIQLLNWPWQQLKLVTYGAPTVGDEIWARKLTVDALSSEFINPSIKLYDKKAFKPSNTKILDDLLDDKRPAAYRVLVPSDPITSRKFVGSEHVGKTVYVHAPKFCDYIPIPNFAGHDPAKIRNYLLAELKDNHIPTESWKSIPMKSINPNYIKSKRGTKKEYIKLKNSFEEYYSKNIMFYNSDIFKKNFEVFLKMLSIHD